MPRGRSTWPQSSPACARRISPKARAGPSNRRGSPPTTAPTWTRPVTTTHPGRFPAGRRRGDRVRRRPRARPDRPRPAAARHRRRQHARRRSLRPRALCRQRLRHGPRGHPLSHRARRQDRRHRRLVLGRAVPPHRAAMGRATHDPSIIWEDPQGRPARSAISRWRSCTGSRTCRRAASRSPASRSRSAPPAAPGSARSASCIGP